MCICMLYNNYTHKIIHMSSKFHYDKNADYAEVNLDFDAAIQRYKNIANCDELSKLESAYKDVWHQVLLKHVGIDFERNFAIGDEVFDFRHDNIVININPTFSHNSTHSFEHLFMNAEQDAHLPCDVHAKKTDTAKAAGFHCIHVWDWDDAKKVINHIKHQIVDKSKIVYARKLKVVEIDKYTANQFLIEHHLQGKCSGNFINLALIEGHPLELLGGYVIHQLMTFGRPRYNKRYQYELLRLCAATKVVGGAERIFKHFIKTYDPESVLSYCDLSKFDGGVYTKLGFDGLGLSYSKHWFNMLTKQHVTNNMLLMHGADRILGTNGGKGTRNEDFMYDHGFVEVYDAGQASYGWHKQ